VPAAYSRCASGPIGPECQKKYKQNNITGDEAMVRVLTIALVSMLFFGTTAFAADAVDGTWKLNVAKSKFSGAAPQSQTRVYTEGPGGTTLDQKLVGADGKEASMHVTLTYDGKENPITGNPDADSGVGKVVNARITNFTLKKGGKVTGSVHRVVSADGKTLTVHNKGAHADGTKYDDTLVFDKQ
jgi:hypothetical protein